MRAVSKRPPLNKHKHNFFEKKAVSLDHAYGRKEHFAQKKTLGPTELRVRQCISKLDQLKMILFAIKSQDNNIIVSQ